MFKPLRSGAAAVAVWVMAAAAAVAQPAPANDTTPPGPLLAMRPQGGLVPAGARYPASYGTTNMINQAGNVTLQTPDPWGWGNTATQLCMVQGFAEGASPPVCPPSGGLNWNGVKDFAGYASIDNVQMAMVNTGRPPRLTLSGRFQPRDFAPDQPLSPDMLKKLRVDMQVETEGPDPWRSFITGWSPDGRTISVAGWYRQHDPADAQVPAGRRLFVNPADRIWNLNTILTLPRGGFPSKGTGIELDMNNARTQPKGDLDIVGILVGSGANPTAPGIDDIGSALIAQGGMLDGIVSRSGHNAFFLAMPDTETGAYNAGFMSYQPRGNAFVAFDGKTGLKFVASAADGSIDLGAHGLPGSPRQSPAIRFYAAGGQQAPSASIQASGGGLALRTAGGAPVTIDAPVVEAASAVPANSHAPCTTGQHAWDANFEYRCVAPNTWKRAALSAW